MTTVYNLTEPLPCPFCGCAAAYYGAAVRCTSFKCNAGLSPNWSTKAVRSVQGDPDERLRQAQSETAERWNHRASRAGPVNWQDDPAADDRWCAGNDFALSRLCAVLKVDPDLVDWDGSDNSLQDESDALILRILTAQAAPAASNALRDVMAERQRQITVEGWTHCNDDAYQTGDLANAAVCYAMTAPMLDRDRTAPAIWPWAASWWKPTNRRRDLIKAGALILAEIERLDRTAAPTEGEA